MKLEEIEKFYSYFHERFPYKGKFLIGGSIINEFELCLWAQGVELSPTVLFNYLTFQFKRQRFLYENSKAYNKFRIGNFSSDIFKGKNLELFLERDRDFDYALEYHPLLQEFGLKQSDLIIRHNEGRTGILEKRIKLTFFNTARGFINCLTNFITPREEDELCKKCISLTECKNTTCI